MTIPHRSLDGRDEGHISRAPFDAGEMGEEKFARRT
jgi:hypothetical protein